MSWTSEERVTMLEDLWELIDMMLMKLNVSDFCEYDSTEDGLYTQIFPDCRLLLTECNIAPDAVSRDILLDFCTTIEQMSASDDKLRLIFRLVRSIHKHSPTECRILKFPYLTIGAHLAEEEAKPPKYFPPGPVGKVFMDGMLLREISAYTSLHELDATCRSIKEACAGTAFYRLNPKGAELLAGCARFRLHLRTRVKSFDAQLIVRLVTKSRIDLVCYRRLEKVFSSDIKISKFDPLSLGDGHRPWEKVKRIEMSDVSDIFNWPERIPNVIDVKFVGYNTLALEGLEYLQKLESLELHPAQKREVGCTYAPESPIGSLPKLRRLVIGGCFIEDFSIFGFMPSLTFLDVSSCEIDSMGPLLQNCPALRQIRTDDLNLVDRIAKIARISGYSEGNVAVINIEQ